MFGYGNYGVPPWAMQPTAAPAAGPTADPMATPAAAPGAPVASPPAPPPGYPPIPQFNHGGFRGDFEHGRFDMPGFATTGSAPGTPWSFGDVNGTMPTLGGGGGISWGGGPTPAPLPASGSTPGVPAAPGAPNVTGTPAAGGPPRWGGMMGGMFTPPSGAAGGGGFGASFPRLSHLFPGAGGQQQGHHGGLLGRLFGWGRGGSQGMGGGMGEHGARGGMGEHGPMPHMPIQGAGFWNPRAAGGAPGTPAAAASTAPTQSVAAGEPHSEPDADQAGGPSDSDADDKAEADKNKERT